ncbi:MAG TPA: metallophosphoesterase, partial [Candidatus Pullichristensenella stercorigallinarum]|nr:metallophosphoesterase [Candidatus Pullichristensenella stercorigallinarum]
MIYITGDTHGDFLRFNTSAFPEQRQMTKDDCVIICGDFGGVWRQRANPDENYWLNWLSSEKSFTTLFVDGNHENFARLNSDEFEIVDFCGGRARKIRENIFHLLRGQVYDIQGARFFAFGGASSHDIEDGILDPAAFASEAAFKLEYRRWRKAGRMFRVKDES